ncbi:hypothetical protein GCM10023088_51780 [Actinomadura verrucosospora]|uniref:hypothetical protein n=1 Tax=Actinomadura verrucosospora TaxID=46165 RepID=UPI0031E99089
MALNSLGVALGEVRRFEEAITAHTDAATIFEQMHDEDRQDEALRNREVAREARQSAQ